MTQSVSIPPQATPNPVADLQQQINQLAGAVNTALGLTRLIPATTLTGGGSSVSLSIVAQGVNILSCTDASVFTMPNTTGGSLGQEEFFITKIGNSTAGNSPQIQLASSSAESFVGLSPGSTAQAGVWDSTTSYKNLRWVKPNTVIGLMQISSGQWQVTRQVGLFGAS